jgi:hypothetical protein
MSRYDEPTGSITAYLDETRALDAQSDDLRRQGLPDQDYWAEEAELMQRRAEAAARHIGPWNPFPPGGPATINTRAKLWAYVTEYEYADVHVAYGRLHALGIEWAPAPPWPELTADERKAELARIGNRLAGEDAAMAVPDRTATVEATVNATQKKIISLCRRKAYDGNTIARKLGLSYDHTRRVLAALVRDGHLANTSNGYRTTKK